MLQQVRPFEGYLKAMQDRPEDAKNQTSTALKYMEEMLKNGQ